MAGLKPMRSSEGLPLPRLQITWVLHPRDHRVNFAFYDIVIPSTPLDMRVTDTPRERQLPKDDAPLNTAGMMWTDGHNIYLRLGLTKVTGSGENRPFISESELDIPFRDGCHIMWDAFALKMPAFVVFEGKAQEIEPREQSR